MKIGVVADTHRNRSGLDQVVEWLQNRHRIAALYHLGDDYEDVVDLADTGLEVVQVPGIYHPRYQDGSLPKIVRETVLGVRITLVHSFEKDAGEDERSVADIILHGHTHKPEIEVEDGRMTMNPGHLKAGKDKNIDPSFGLLDIQERTIRASIFGTDHKEKDSVELIRSESGLYRA